LSDDVIWSLQSHLPASRPVSSAHEQHGADADPVGAQLKGRSLSRLRCETILTCQLRAAGAIPADLHSCALLTGRHSGSTMNHGHSLSVHNRQDTHPGNKGR
jgi:hypothetical protein